jgi:NAD(P)-dependent dehydrogenase (short-subunit alcohol dehydrogenase family)
VSQIFINGREFLDGSLDLDDPSPLLGFDLELTKSLATAWAKDNIQVNAVLPGWIDTDLTRGARAEVPGLHEGVLARTPAGRWGAPEDSPGSPSSWRADPNRSLRRVLWFANFRKFWAALRA